jgi:hypothetical protein
MTKIHLLTITPMGILVVYREGVGRRWMVRRKMVESEIGLKRLKMTNAKMPKESFHNNKPHQISLEAVSDEAYFLFRG